MICGSIESKSTLYLTPTIIAQVLFFTIQPIYGHPMADRALIYDSSTQIHAGWLLCCSSELLEPYRTTIEEEYRNLGHELSLFEESVEFVDPCGNLIGDAFCALSSRHRGPCLKELVKGCHRTPACIRHIAHNGCCKVVQKCPPTSRTAELCATCSLSDD